MLQEAVIKGDLFSVKIILDSSHERMKLSHENCVCLAAREKQTDIVELLLDHGFNVNEEDAHGHAPIYYSVIQNDVKITELLLQRGAEPNGKHDLIFSAAREGFGNVAKVLLDFGAEVNAKDKYGQTPLHHAILQDSAVFTFLKKPVIINLCEMENVVKVLLNKGSDVNAKTVNGFSPLHFAIKLKYASIVHVLLEHKADFHSLVDYYIKSPKLLQFSVKSNRTVTLGNLKPRPRLTTVLHIAAELNDIASLNMLLSAGADVDGVQYDGTTPLIVAIKLQHDTVVKVLLDFGADVEQRNKYGLTPLHVACRTGSINVFNSLLRAGANINAICNREKVPFQYVLQLELEMKAEYLVEDFYYYADRYYQKMYSNSRKMKTALQKYCIMMYINGFYLHDYNKEVAMKNSCTLQLVSKKEIDNFSKNVIICSNVTLYHIFDQIRYPVFIQNPNVLTGLEQAVVVANAKYPGLGNVVYFLVRKARVRVGLIDKGVQWFINLNRDNIHLPMLPFDVLEVVFSFLLDDEIRYLVEYGDG